MKIFRMVLFSTFAIVAMSLIELFAIFPLFNEPSTILNIIALVITFVIIYGIGQTLYWAWKNISKEL